MNTTNFLELAKNRRSIRAYKQDPVEKEKLISCAEAVRLAPSACNSQPWTVIMVTDTELKNKLAKLTRGPAGTFNRFADQAPVIAALVAEPSNVTAQMGNVFKKIQFNLVDIGIAAEHFCLQARDQGLGTCMIGWFDKKAASRLLHIPKGKTVPLLITLGYPAKDWGKPRGRKELDSILRWNDYKTIVQPKL